MSSLSIVKTEEEYYELILSTIADAIGNRSKIRLFSRRRIKNVIKWGWVIEYNGYYEITEAGVRQLTHGIKIPRIVRVRKPTQNEYIVLMSIYWQRGIHVAPEKRYGSAINKCYKNGWIEGREITIYGYKSLELADYDLVFTNQVEWVEDSRNPRKPFFFGGAYEIRGCMDDAREELLKHRRYVIFQFNGSIYSPCYGMLLVVRYNHTRIGRIQKWRFGSPVGRWIYKDGVKSTLLWITRQIQSMGMEEPWAVFSYDRKAWITDEDGDEEWDEMVR